MGLPKEIISHADLISRLDYQGKKIYQPELEKRLVSRALELAQSGTGIEPIKQNLDQLREEILKKRIETAAVDRQVEELYERTRYQVELYPDTLESLRMFKDQAKANLAIFTYGDPVFQATKTASLLKEAPVSEIWLTRVAKGEFLKAVINERVHQQVELTYHYPETQPRNDGIHFAEWQVGFVLFDDDPSQVGNMMSVAEELDLAAFGVVRVRREGTKRAYRRFERRSETSGEMVMTNTEADLALYHEAVGRMYQRLPEMWLRRLVRKHGETPLLRGDSTIQAIFSSYCQRRGLTTEEGQRQMLLEAGWLPQLTVEAGGVEKTLWTRGGEKGKK